MDRIISIEQIEFELIETTEEEHYEYRRYSASNWEVRMGESWEPLFHCEDMEEMYQAFIDKQT